MFDTDSAVAFCCILLIAQAETGPIAPQDAVLPLTGEEFQASAVLLALYIRLALDHDSEFSVRIDETVAVPQLA